MVKRIGNNLFFALVLVGAVAILYVMGRQMSPDLTPDAWYLVASQSPDGGVTVIPMESAKACEDLKGEIAPKTKSGIKLSCTLGRDYHGPA